MALNVLSCPATTVDVERSFSFGRDYVSLKRHRLSSSSVTKGMTVAFYSKNRKIKPGMLHKWKLKKANETKQKGKGKGKYLRIATLAVRKARDASRTAPQNSNIESFEAANK
ncbi:hypothetical protein PSTG_09583 [Puccinia striiformis f. sp. tritici PST-78]|uniref:HAT C-terminal dimerisation domain-containing protein n=1 Tax=Puccinia striiformis f. sp. tritici PST-78 TaxID=1165861 RepID=A0A0L0VD99_9BASI|nr:hypothetical protein PSTG_09583 [Puccinia striiformis f. sp. tritici PST-78]